MSLTVHDDTAPQHGRESLLNVSQDMRLMVASANPQACLALSPSKPTADADGSSQVPPGGARVASPQQPSPELLMSLGVKVRDFAYENILPAIVPVPRVPRQVQPTPRALKRSQRDWDDKEGPMISSQPPSGKPAAKKPKPLERELTEPLQESPVQHTRTLGRIRRVCSIIAPPPRRALPMSPHTRFPAGPPTSPLTPLLSHITSQDSEFVQTSPAFPFVVHVDDTSTIPASQIVSESQPVSFRPALYTRFTLDPCSSLRCSPAPSPQNGLPAPLTSPFLELPSPNEESEANPGARKRRGRRTAGTTPTPSRYQLRQRPIPSSRASSLSRCSLQPNGTTTKSLSRQAHRMR